MFKTKISRNEIEELSHAWETCRIPIESLAEMHITHLRYIDFLEAKLKKLENPPFEEEFLAK